MKPRHLNLTVIIAAFVALALPTNAAVTNTQQEVRHMKRIALILAVFVSLLVSASAAAHTHRRPTHHARHHAALHRQIAHRASACKGCEYFPVLEEWLTPEEGQEIRAFEAELPRLVSEVEADTETEAELNEQFISRSY